MDFCLTEPSFVRTLVQLLHIEKFIILLTPVWSMSDSSRTSCEHHNANGYVVLHSCTLSYLPWCSRQSLREQTNTDSYLITKPQPFNATCNTKRGWTSSSLGNASYHFRKYYRRRETIKTITIINRNFTISTAPFNDCVCYCRPS